jgi:L-alanine-DL-glutamate epimerase-like enolase superfamily enzyme
MRIISVRSSLLSYVLPEPLKLRYFGGERTMVKRDAMLVRVETEFGIVGYSPGQGTLEAKTAVDEVIGPFLTGRLLRDPDALRVQFLEGPGKRAPELARLYCAVEIALYDALGQAHQVPVSELVGGRVRDRIRLYGSAGVHMSQDQYAQEATAIAALGFRAYKMQSGIGPEQDVEAVRLVRQAVGPDFDLMVAAQTWWRMGDRNYVASQVDSIAERLAEYRIAWLEEPLPPQDREGYRRLKQLDYVPLAAGNHEPDELRHMDLVISGVVDYVQMDIAAQGGYPTARRLLPEIAQQGLKFAFHAMGTALDVVAAAHLGICWPDSLVEWLEYPCYSAASGARMYPFPLAAEILRDPLELDHGDLLVPKGPGLGVSVDESVVERYPWAPGPSSFFDVQIPPERLAGS